MTGETPAVRLRKGDRELLALMAQAPTNPYGSVYYVPGRRHETNTEGRTRYKFERFQPAQYGKTYVRVTAPIERLLDAGLVDYPADERRCDVTLTQAGRDWLLAYEASTQPVSQTTATPL